MKQSRALLATAQRDLFGPVDRRGFLRVSADFVNSPIMYEAMKLLGLTVGEIMKKSFNSYTQILTITGDILAPVPKGKSPLTYVIEMSDVRPTFGNMTINGMVFPVALPGNRTYTLKVEGSNQAIASVVEARPAQADAHWSNQRDHNYDDNDPPF
jgi:hypothetical protein